MTEPQSQLSQSQLSQSQLSQPQRVRRPIGERWRDFLEQNVPLDKSGDDRIEDLLDQLRDERERRSSGQAPQ